MFSLWYSLKEEEVELLAKLCAIGTPQKWQDSIPALNTSTYQNAEYEAHLF